MIHPIEYRYGSDEMRTIFSRDSWVRYAIDVEFAVLESLVELGIIDLSKDSVKEAYEKALGINYEKVSELEKVYRHEVFALVYAIYERIGGEVGKYIHTGLTSNDVLDNVSMMQIRDGLKLILKRLDGLINKLKEFVVEYSGLPVLGRTHGRGAVPITLGFRFMLYLDELLRCKHEVEYALNKYVCGKVGGAVGSQVELHPHGPHVEELVLRKLGLSPAATYLQILPRDLFANILYRLLILSSVLEHISNEIRVLSRSGIEELSEGFEKAQVGSSVMPHKRNPVVSEKICGLARYLRGLASSILENIVFEDERDLRNSSFERTVIPEVFLLVDEQIISLTKVLEGLMVFQEKCRENIEREGFKIFSSVLLHIGVRKGGDRQKLHEKLKEVFKREYRSLDELYEVFKEDALLSTYYSYDDLKRASDINLYISSCEAKVKRFLEGLDKS